METKEDDLSTAYIVSPLPLCTSFIFSTLYFATVVRGFNHQTTKIQETEVHL